MMQALSLRTVAEACGVAWSQPDVQCDDVSIDSRKAKVGDLFVAIRGERFDGHDFLADVQAAGVAAAIVERINPSVALPQLVVADAVHALGVVAAINRHLFSGRVIGLTGSAGKTTTKEMIAAILSQTGTPLVTEGNLNNHLGVPLTLLRLSAEHDCAVIEMGASALGEIRYLTRLVKPDVALVTNVGAAHIEGFGSIENVAQGKAEIFEGLPAGGVAILNLDNIYTAAYGGVLSARYRVLECSMRSVADVYGSNIVQSEKGMRFTLHAGDCEADIALAFLGEHNVGNAVAAAACCLAVGASFADVVAGLQQAQPYKGRLQVKTGVRACRVIDDTYNANPASVQMAINTLLQASGEKYLVLGDMGELGSVAENLHRETGAYAKRAGLQHLFAVGALSQATVEGFGAGARHFPDWHSLAVHCRSLAQSQAVFLVKGSRSTGMERVVQVLLEAETENPETKTC